MVALDSMVQAGLGKHATFKRSGLDHSNGAFQQVLRCSYGPNDVCLFCLFDESSVAVHAVQYSTSAGSTHTHARASPSQWRAHMLSCSQRLSAHLATPCSCAFMAGACSYTTSLGGEEDSREREREREGVARRESRRRGTIH